MAGTASPAPGGSGCGVRKLRLPGTSLRKPLSGPKPLRAVASRMGGQEVALLHPPWGTGHFVPQAHAASPERRRTHHPHRPEPPGSLGQGPALPLTERMASLMWASRWSFRSVAPVSGHVKHTPGTVRCAEPSSLASGTWRGCRRLSPEPPRRPLCGWALGHPGPAPQPRRAPFLLCKMA